MNKLKEIIHHFFIPSKKNNFKSKLLHLDFLTFYLIIALVFTVMAKEFKTGTVLGFATDITVDKLYELTNLERAKNNLPPLVYNDKLAAAADKKAHHMFSNNYWAHFAPDGTTPWSFITGADYQYSVAGENLAKGFLFSDAVVKAWMDSPTHRENLLRDSYKDVGFAILNGNLNGEPVTLVVQMFGTQLDLAPNIEQGSTSSEVPVARVLKEPVKTEYHGAPAVLANTDKNQPVINIFPAFFNLNMLFLLLLIAALLLDFYVTKRMNIFKVGGKNIAHVLFIGFIILGIWIISKGGLIQ